MLCSLLEHTLRSPGSTETVRAAAALLLFKQERGHGPVPHYRNKKVVFVVLVSKRLTPMAATAEGIMVDHV
jgi:hypothetical protein